MASSLSRTGGSGARRGRIAGALATIVGILAVLGAIGAIGAGAASAEVIPSGGDFQTTPSSWTATGLSGNLNTVSASQVSSGANTFYRTQYTTPANLLGAGLANMAATEGITSPTFTWTQGAPQSIVASFDSGVQFNGLLGVDSDAGIGMYLQNTTTNTETLLASRRLTQDSPDFSTVSASVSPSLLITGDSYRVQVRITFSPTVLVAGATTVDLDDVLLTETPPTPPAPVLSTGSASITGVTSTGATAVATIDPGSAATTVQVNYGTTMSYGLSTGTYTIPANSGPTQVSIPISGLSPSTGYDAQIVATNAGGSTPSANLSFMTSTNAGTPPTVSSGSAQGSPGERTATVGATIDDFGRGSTYEVQYGTTTSYGSTTAAQVNPPGLTGATPVTTSLSGLTPGTLYHAQYVVTSSAGTVTDSDFTFMTAAASPPAVSNPTASTTSTDGTQETVRATVDPGANDTQVAISYGATSSYGSTTSSVLVSGGSGPQTVSIPISGLTPGDVYHYTVTATNVDGSAGSADATFVPTSQTSPPVGQTSVSAGPGETTATLASTMNTGGNGGSYYVQYGTTNAYGSQTATQTLAATNANQQLTGSLSGLQPGTTYHAQFVAIVNGYATSYGSDFTFTTAPASPPVIDAGPNAGTSDSAGDQETITATVDPGAHDTQVSVSYGTSSSYGSTTAATAIPANSGATAVSIPISNLTPGTTYHYQLTATSSDGSVSSTDATFVPTAATNTPAVTQTSASPGSTSGSETLTAVVDSNGSGGTYAVQYGPDANYGSETTSQTISTSSNDPTLSTTLTNLQPGMTYHARFVVMVSGQPTSYGPDQTFTVNGPPVYSSAPSATNGTSGTQETISATINPVGLQTTVTVDYGAGSTYGSQSVPVTIPAGDSPQTVQITLNGLVAGNTYHYDVVANNPAGTSIAPDDTFTPSSQTSPAVGTTSTSGAPGETAATLDASINTAGSGGGYYLQYGTSTAYGSQTATQSLDGTTSNQPLSASLTGLIPGTTYHVRFVVLANGYPASDGPDFTFTTAPLSPPSIAAGGPTATATSADGTQETIAATVNPGGHDTTVSIDYGTTSAYGSTATASVIPGGGGPTTVSILLSGLTPGTTYHYALLAGNVDGSAQSVDQTFTPMSTNAAPVGTTTTTQSPGTSTATLDSSVDTGGNGGTYYVEYGYGTDYGSRTATETLAAASGPQTLHVSLSGLRSGTTYHVRFVVFVDGHPVSYGHDFTFKTAGRGHTIIGPASGAAGCVAAYVGASARTLKVLSLPAGAQLTSRHGLRIALVRGVKVSGRATFQVAGGRRTRIRGRAFTITRSQLTTGRTATVRVVIPQRHRRSLVLTLRIGTTGCGIQLSTVTVRRSLQLRLRLPLGARRLAFTLPRGMAAPTAVALTTPLGARTLALTGHGPKLRLRARAGALRVTAHGSSITVTGLPAATIGLSLRFPASRASGRVTARVSQRTGGAASAHLTVGRRVRRR